MKLIFSALCEHAEVRPDGRLDVHGAFHDLYAPGFPAKQDRMVLVLVVEWERSDQGSYQFRASLEDPDGAEMGRVEIDTEVRPTLATLPPPRTKLVTPLEEVVFARPGTHRFRVRIKGTDLEGPRVTLFEQPEGEDPDAGQRVPTEGPPRA